MLDTKSGISFILDSQSVLKNNLKESWEKFNFKDYSGDEVVTVVIADKRFEPLFNKNHKESLKRHNVRVEGFYLNGTVVIGKVSDIIQVCDECHVMNPHKILIEAAEAKDEDDEDDEDND